MDLFVLVLRQKYVNWNLEKSVNPDVLKPSAGPDINEKVWVKILLYPRKHGWEFTLKANNNQSGTYTDLQDDYSEGGPISGSIFASLGSPCPTHSLQMWDEVHLQLDRIRAWQWAPHSCLQLHSKEITCCGTYISSKTFAAVQFLSFHLVSHTKSHTLKGHVDCLSGCIANCFDIISPHITKTTEI